MKKFRTYLVKRGPKRSQAVQHHDSHRREGFGRGQQHYVGQRYQQGPTAVKSHVGSVRSKISTQDGVDNLENEAITESIPTAIEHGHAKMSPGGDSKSLDKSETPTNVLQLPGEPSIPVKEEAPKSPDNSQVKEKVLQDDNVSRLDVWFESLETSRDSVQPASSSTPTIEGFMNPIDCFTAFTATESTFDEHNERTLKDTTSSPPSTATERSWTLPPRHLHDPVPETSLPSTRNPTTSVDAQISESLNDTMSSLPTVLNKSVPVAEVDQSTTHSAISQQHLKRSSINSQQPHSNHESEEWDTLSVISDPKANITHGPSLPLSNWKAGPGLGHNPSIQIDQPQTLMAGSQNRNLYSREKDWERVKRMRAEVWSLRSKIHELRSVLRQKQLAKSTADDSFFRFVRRQAVGENSFRSLDEQKALEALLGDCEIARNEYGPLEDDLNLLENDLGNQEYSLQKLEGRVYDRPINLPESQPNMLDIEPSQPLTSSEYSESDTSQHFHPLVTEYLSKMGDVDIFQERLDWHLDEKETLEEEKEKRQRVGLDLAPPDQEWLDNYSAAESELLAQLRLAEEIAEKLRVDCFSRGLIDEEGNPTDFEHRERQTFATENVDARNETSEYVKFPTLIPPPNGKQITLGDSRPDDESNMGEGSTSGPRFRVDQWILHQLRMSVLGVKLLADTFEMENKVAIKDEGRWQADVLATACVSNELWTDLLTLHLSSGLPTARMN